MYEERIVSEGSEIVKTMQIGQNLAADFFCESRIQRLEDDPSRRLRHGADDLQTQSAHRQTCKFTMRFAAAAHGHSTAQSGPARRPVRNHI